MRVRSTAASVIAVALLLTGCATSTPPGGTETAASTSPDARPTGGEEVDLAAAWLDGGRMVGVVTWGSSSCPPSAGEVSYEDGVLEVLLTEVSEGSACTADLAPRATLVGVPEGVDPQQDLRVLAIGDGYQGEAALAGVPGLEAGGGTDYLPSAGSTEIDGQIVLVTWGSSSCAPSIVDAVATSETTATVTFATPPADQVCTMDMAPRALVLQIDGLAGDGVTLTLTGDPQFDGVEVAVLPN